MYGMARLSGGQYTVYLPGVLLGLLGSGNIMYEERTGAGTTWIIKTLMVLQQSIHHVRQSDDSVKFNHADNLTD